MSKFSVSPATQARTTENQAEMTPPAKLKIPTQSRARTTMFPGSSLAARELGVHRSHLHRVLIGDRQSASLMAGWKSWLKRNPQFRQLQKS